MAVTRLDQVALRAHRLGRLRAEMAARGIAACVLFDPAEKAWRIPERYVANRYFVSAHGVGMTGEYPLLYHELDFAGSGYDGVLEPGTTLCVESYIAEPGGGEGVKLEEQVLLADHGVELLSHFPFEEDLLGREL